MRSIALANQKGGVGKTTTAVHLAHGLALTGDCTVILDLDPQANATLGVQGMAERNGIETGEDLDADSAFQALQRLDDQLWILPSPGVHRNIDRRTVPDTKKLAALCSQLQDEGVEWLIVDCPPRMDAWGWAGLELCQQVLLPVQAEFFAMHGLSQMIQTLESARRQFPGRAELLGVVATMVDAREEITREVLDDLRSNLGPRMLDSLVYRDLILVEAASHGLTLFDYRIDAKGSLCYGALVREVKHGRA
ncbi:MAG: ParA family protein [Planctomycetes bacterium]|nr:ParA family protein [Planctomycetota bacterium]